jgi:hypothetical protein
MKSSISHLIRGLTFRGNRSLFVAMIMVLSLSTVSFGQEYASGQTDAHVNDSFTIPPLGPTINVVGTVTGAANVTGPADANFATISAEGVNVLGAIKISAKASITMTLPTPVAAGGNSFVRIDAPTQTGLNVDLSSLVNLLGLLESNSITVTTSAGTAQKNLVRDKNGNLYFQVTSSAAYNTIKVEVDFAGSEGLLGALLEVGTLNLKVYHVLTYENSVLADCAAQEFSYVGIDPDLTITSGSVSNPVLQLTLTNAIQNPTNAIDGNLSTFSILQNGNIGAASSISQSFFMAKTAPASNQVVATLSASPGLIDLTVLSGITIQAYNGTTAVGTPQALSSYLIGLSLLDFQTTARTITFTPGAAHNRIVITSTALADVLTSIRIHEIGSRPPIAFSGGRVVGSMAGEPVSSSILDATLNTTPALPGFSIGCSTPAQHTYSLFEVDQSARTLSGTLPPSFVLSSAGLLTGNPALDENDTYNFDVLAVNQFGQRAITPFIITIETNLPVTLVKFDAVAEGKTTALTWSTSAETNSDRFEIERSLTGKNWSKIGTVSSNHESTSLQYYSFVDGKPSDGQNLYRLRMIDLDETFSYSQIKNVNFANSDYLYPNPVSANENLSINLTDWSNIKMVKVINATGKTVFEASNALSNGISTRNLTAGTYVLKMIHNNGSVSTHKFVRQ